MELEGKIIVCFEFMGKQSFQGKQSFTKVQNQYQTNIN